MSDINSKWASMVALSGAAFQAGVQPKPTLPPAPPSVPIVPGQAPAGMIQAEADLLAAWLAKHWSEYDSVQYNVRVGHGVDPGDSVPDFARQAAIANSQRRVDALLFSASQPTIVEVKVRGSLWAIGQLLGYQQLYIRDHPGIAPRLFAVCATMDADSAYVYEKLGIPFQAMLG